MGRSNLKSEHAYVLHKLVIRYRAACFFTIYIMSLKSGEAERTIEYVRVVMSLFLTEVNVLYTIDTHQCEALLICGQMLL